MVRYNSKVLLKQRSHFVSGLILRISGKVLSVRDRSDYPFYGKEFVRENKKIEDESLTNKNMFLFDTPKRLFN